MIVSFISCFTDNYWQSDILEDMEKRFSQL